MVITMRVPTPTTMPAISRPLNCLPPPSDGEAEVVAVSGVAAVVERVPAGPVPDPGVVACPPDNVVSRV